MSYQQLLQKMNRLHFLQMLGNLTDDLLGQLIGDTSSLAEIQSNQLIEARLFLKLKSKPKEMAQETFQRVMGAIATNITNDSGLVIRTKDGNKFTGAAVKVKSLFPLNVWRQTAL